MDVFCNDERRDQKYNNRDNFIDFKLCDISVTESLRRNLFCYIIIVLTCSIYEFLACFTMDKKLNSTSATISILCLPVCFCKLTLLTIKFLYNNCFFSPYPFLMHVANFAVRTNFENCNGY